MHNWNFFCRAGMVDEGNLPAVATGRSAAIPTLQFICAFFLLAALPLFATEPLCIFAAAGTAPAMNEIAAVFTKETGTQVVFNFANAGVLARQINAGAPFDLFFSANEKWMDVVAVSGLIDSTSRIVLLENELVIIVPKGQVEPAPDRFIRPWAGEKFSGRFATGDQSTPLGIYARQAFEELGWWEPLQGHLCAGDTVNKALNYVALGEADAGVVFRSVGLLRQRTGRCCRLDSGAPARSHSISDCGSGECPARRIPVFGGSSEETRAPHV